MRMNKTHDLLIPALRQYKHNDGEGFVVAYDKQTVDRIVDKLLIEIKAYKMGIFKPEVRNE